MIHRERSGLAVVGKVWYHIIRDFASLRLPTVSLNHVFVLSRFFLRVRISWRLLHGWR